MSFFSYDKQLEQIGTNILNLIWEEFPDLNPNQIAITWIVYDSPVIVNTGGAILSQEFWQYQVRGYSYRGMEPIYPASVVKLFYLVAIHEWLQAGLLSLTPEIKRAMVDAMVDSSNDATSLLVDVLTNTTSGPELPPESFATWKYQRNIINRYFQSLGWEELEKINVNQKTWCDGPYGRERAFVGESLENRNILVTDGVARLLHSIIGGVAVSSSRSQMMMDLLKRQPGMTKIADDEEENQVTGFLGEALPPETNLWSKAGWTSKVRHDAAYIESPNLAPYLLVVFIESKLYSKNYKLFPFISQCFMNKMKVLSTK